MAGLYSSRNAMAVRPRFAVEEMGPPQPYPSTQEVVQNFGQGVYRGAMFTPELLAEAALMARYPEPSDMAPEDFAAYMAMLEQQQQDAEMPAEGLFGQMVAPDVTDLMPGIGGALGAMYVPLRNVDLAKLTRAASGEVVDDIPRAFSALHDRMPRVEIDDSAARMLQQEAINLRAGNDVAYNLNTMRDTLDHPALWEEMPSLQRIGATMARVGDERALYMPPRPERPDSFGNISFAADSIGTADDALPLIGHELQHAVQERGGFARGGSPSVAQAEEYYNNRLMNAVARDPRVERAYDNFAKIDALASSGQLDNPALYDEAEQSLLSLPNGQQIMDAHYASLALGEGKGAEQVWANDYYRNLAGEIEARDTAARMNMNAMARARTQPYTGYQVRPDGTFGPAYDIGGNIPLEDYIVRRDGGNAMSLPKDDSLPGRAKKFFGTTYNQNAAGYIMDDGSMLDFSGYHYGEPGSRSTRNVDHRELSGSSRYLNWGDEDLASEGGSRGMFEFMDKSGAIRWMPESGGASMAGVPTRQQAERIIKNFNELKRNGAASELLIDFDNPSNMDTIESLILERPTVDGLIREAQRVYSVVGQRAVLPNGQYSVDSFDWAKVSDWMRKNGYDSRGADDARERIGKRLNTTTLTDDHLKALEYGRKK